MSEANMLEKRNKICAAIEQVLSIPSAGHASGGELADTIYDAVLASGYDFVKIVPEVKTITGRSENSAYAIATMREHGGAT